MDDLHLGAVEARFADLIWKYEPLSSRALVALCGEAGKNPPPTLF